MKQIMKWGALISGLLTGILLWMGPEGGWMPPMAITGGTIFYHLSIRLLIGGAFDKVMYNQTDYRKK